MKVSWDTGILNFLLQKNENNVLITSINNQKWYFWKIWYIFVYRNLTNGLKHSYLHSLLMLKISFPNESNFFYCYNESLCYKSLVDSPSEFPTITTKHQWVIICCYYSLFFPVLIFIYGTCWFFVIRESKNATWLKNYNIKIGVLWKQKIGPKNCSLDFSIMIKSLFQKIPDTPPHNDFPWKKCFKIPCFIFQFFQTFST